LTQGLGHIIYQVMLPSFLHPVILKFIGMAFGI